MNKIVSYAKPKADMFEVYFVEAEDLNADIRKNNVSFLSSGDSIGFSVRVVKDGRIGISYTNDVKKYKECVERALKIAKLSRKDKHFVSFARKSKITKVKNYSKKLKEFEDISSFNKRFLSHLGSVDKSIVLSEGSYLKTDRKVSVINSEGVDVRMRELDNAFSYIISIRKNGLHEMADGDAHSKDVLDPSIANKGAERLISILNKKKVESGEMKIILKPSALSALFDNAFSFAVNGENVLQKKSIFTNNLNEEVMDKKLSLVDNATRPMLVNTREADDEGVASRKTVIVKDGVLKNFLYNTYYANMAKKESTGNGFRSVASPPSISPTNLIFDGKGKQDLIKEMDKGIVINKLLGIHTMNHATGDFSLSIDEGHYVEKGEIKHAVKDTMIAGNFFELIKEVSMIGNDIYWLASGTYIPSMMFPKVKVI